MNDREKFLFVFMILSNTVQKRVVTKKILKDEIEGVYKMIRSIKELGFNEDLEDFINCVSRIFEEYSESKEGFLEWMNKSMKDPRKSSLFKNLSDREKFLMVFTLLASPICNMFEEDTEEG